MEMELLMTTHKDILFRIPGFVKQNSSVYHIISHNELKELTMQVRCQRCGWSSNLSRDFMIAAVEEAKEKKLKYCQVECAKCRHGIKVPIRQLRRFVPRTPKEEKSADKD
jgi:hypothetical protein